MTSNFNVSPPNLKNARTVEFHQGYRCAPSDR